MGLFNRGSDDNENCSHHHHWDEYQEDWDSIRTRVKHENVRFSDGPGAGSERIPVVSIEVPKVRRCQHEGCTATDHHSFNNTYQVPHALLSRGQDLRLLAHLAEALNGEHGEEIGYALLGRAQDIHDNPDDGFEHVAEHLKALGQEVLDSTGE